jgi:hypothetical protein
VDGQCEHIKANGKRCQARALVGSRWCFFHDPSKAQARKDARQKGGERSRKPTITLPIGAAGPSPKTVAEVVELLAETISQVRTGAIDPKVANATGYLANVQLRALQDSELARKVEENDKAIVALKGELEAMRHEQHAQTTAGAAANGAGRPASGHGEEPPAGSDSEGRAADNGAGGAPAGPVAEGAADGEDPDDIPPMFA